MLEALGHLGIFTLQTIIIVAAILMVVAGIVAIAMKGKLKDKAKIIIKKMNDHYDDLENIINDQTLSKTELKEKLKMEKIDKKKKKKTKKTVKKSRIYVINFEGDIKASATDLLREEITAILTVATPNDEVFVKLESAGGMVHCYGLAASQLQRIRDAKIPLTISIDKVAASGGYMMACVANKIISAPFAIIGSIGVIAQLPNFHRWLKKHDVDFEQISAGEYKRTLTLFGENTKKDRQKMQEDVNETHVLFKEFIEMHRPQADINQVATGEHWFGIKALKLNLVDSLQTSDDYLMSTRKTKDIYQIEYKKKQKITEKLAQQMQKMGINCFHPFLQV